MTTSHEQAGARAGESSSLADLRPVCDASFVQKLRAIRDTLTEGLVEREVAVRLSLLAALAGEHLLMLGPPGTAKSLIARRLHLAFSESTYFERLLTRFTVPEELFGPLSIKGLEEDRYERLTDAYLPKASIAFLDEIFKANSAILNSLLTLLNEREFDNGVSRDETPLVAVIGASNELPEGEELDALFDRFLLRLHVGPVTKDAFPTLLALRDRAVPEVAHELKLDAQELLAVQNAAAAVEVPPDVTALLCDLRDWCTAEDVQVSDRRWRKVVKLLQVSAATHGRTQVSIWDCWLLQHCVWNTPEAREKVFEWYAARVGASAVMNPERLTRIVVSFEARLKANRESRSQTRDDQGRLVFKDAHGKRTFEVTGPAQKRRGEDVLFLAPANGLLGCDRLHDRTNGGAGYTRDELNNIQVGGSHYDRQRFGRWSGRDAYLADPNNWLMEDVAFAPVLEPTRFSGFYVEGVRGELGKLKEEVGGYLEGLLQHLDSLKADICDHLWVLPEFAELAAQNLEQTRRDVDALLMRVDELHAGFEALPREVAVRSVRGTRSWHAFERGLRVSLGRSRPCSARRSVRSGQRSGSRTSVSLVLRSCVLLRTQVCAARAVAGPRFGS